MTQIALIWVSEQLSLSSRVLMQEPVFTGKKKLEVNMVKYQNKTTTTKNKNKKQNVIAEHRLKREET